MVSKAKAVAAASTCLASTTLSAWNVPRDRPSDMGLPSAVIREMVEVQAGEIPM